MQKFAILNELNDIYMFKNRNATEEPERVFIHIIRYADNETKKDWQGKMQNIREVVVDGVKSIKDKMEKQNAKIESVEQEMSDQLKLIVKMLVKN